MSGDAGETKPRRVSRWDRPPPPHDWRWVVSGIGRALIVLGVLMFAFVAYLLWGTGIEYSQAQDDLDEQWEQLVVTAPTTIAAPTSTAPPITVPDATIPRPSTTTTTTAPVTATTVTTTLTTTGATTTAPGPPVQPIAPPAAGDVVARLSAPTIGLDQVNVVSGVRVEDLKKGPGHFPETPLPGQYGNAAIAGHRTTYGGPFSRVDELQIGDEIVVETLAGRYVYRMTGSEIVDPSEYRVIATTDPTKATLTLTSCHPLRSAKQRIIIYAELDTSQSSPPGAMTSNYVPVGEPTEATPTTIPGDDATTPDPTVPAPSTSETATSEPATSEPATSAPEPSSPPASDPPASDPGAATTSTPGSAAPFPPTTIPPSASGVVGDASADAFSHGWFDDPGAWPQIALWGLALGAFVAGAYLLARRLRRVWVGALAGAAPVVVVLYFFFQNVNRLLPPGL